MTCCDDGILRARLDGELAGTELAEVDQHLASCADCRARTEKLSAETASARDLLATLAPAGNDTALNATAAYSELEWE